MNALHYYCVSGCVCLFLFSFPRTSEVKMPMAAKAAHTMNAAWKPARNVFWRSLTPLVERFCPCDESSAGDAISQRRWGARL